MPFGGSFWQQITLFYPLIMAPWTLPQSTHLLTLPITMTHVACTLCNPTLIPLCICPFAVGLVALVSVRVSHQLIVQNSSRLQYTTVESIPLLDVCICQVRPPLNYSPNLQSNTNLNMFWILFCSILSFPLNFWLRLSVDSSVAYARITEFSVILTTIYLIQPLSHRLRAVYSIVRVMKTG